MEKITISGVPEHFNFPWLKVIEEQPFREEGYFLHWAEEPKGSGAMNQAIREGQADVAIILTESFIRDKVEGNPGKIIGLHVKSPLTWGIHVSSGSAIEEVEALKEATFLISRYGSGSHLMAYLLARKNGWDLSRLKFELVGDLEGAKKALQRPAPNAFLWEKFTTMPLVQQGLFRRIGEIPTPWPCFVMVAAKDALVNHSPLLKRLQGLVYEKSLSLPLAMDFPQALSEKYGIETAAIKQWLNQTEWSTNEEIQKGDLDHTMETLKTLDLISHVIPAEELVDPTFVLLK